MYYVISDHLGTPQQIVDSSGTVVWKAAFQPFGEAQVVNETITNNIRFPGQYFDAETRLHYNWNRYYDPDTGRYLAPDPIGLAGGLNLFAYASGNPVNYIDPDGNFAITGMIIAAAVLVGTNPDIANAPAVNDETYASNGAAGIATDAVAGGALGYAGGKIAGKLISRCAEKSIPKTKALTSPWPPNRGFFGKPKTQTLKPGTKIDRYGYEGGSFVSPKGVPFKNRALHPTSSSKPYNKYEVVKPLDVNAGPTAPWFGEPGGGMQYELPSSVSNLIKQGVLKRAP